GIWTVGGSVGFSSSKQKGAGKATTIIEFLPEAGYFIIDDLGVGLNALYSRTSQGNTSLTEYAIGPWARYYVYHDAFAQASFLAGSLTIDGDFGKAKTSNNKVEVGLGYSAWLADAVALEPLVFFNMSKSKDENTDPVSTNTFGLRIGLKIFIGKN
ncbi:MAG: hypothetical protein ABJB16_17815, partial [Saprospiraceae bacterium]